MKNAYLSIPLLKQYLSWESTLFDYLFAKLQDIWYWNDKNKIGFLSAYLVENFFAISMVILISDKNVYNWSYFIFSG